MSETVPFVTMAKPIGSFCNMSCEYCYYLHADNGEDFANIRMSDSLLETYIRDYIAQCGGEVVSFTWHGGEPTLAGLDFYEKVMELEKKYLPEGKQCWNNLQTNALLINEDWCRFLKKHHWDIGVSIDGTRYVHDLYRHDAGGNGTYERVQKAVKLLEKNGIHPDLLCTVTADTARNGKAVYTALSAFRTGWIQFIPIVRRDSEGNVTPDSVTPELYGKFLKDVFREWIRHDLGKTNVQIFAETSLVLAGGHSNVCWFSETCGNVLIVERDGGVYSCDHFVDQEHKLGSLPADSLAALAAGEKQRQFGNSKRDSLTQKCRNCPWLHICHGCCPKDRFLVNEDGEPGQYYLCEGLRDFFAYAVPQLEEAMDLSRKGKSPQEIMTLLRRK